MKIYYVGSVLIILAKLANFGLLCLSLTHFGSDCLKLVQFGSR